MKLEAEAFSVLYYPSWSINILKSDNSIYLKKQQSFQIAAFLHHIIRYIGKTRLTDVNILLLTDQQIQLFL